LKWAGAEPALFYAWGTLGSGGQRGRRVLGYRGVLPASMPLIVGAYEPGDVSAASVSAAGALVKKRPSEAPTP